MGSFGEAVVSLLDTYTKCLSLLKGLRQHGSPSDSQSRLGGSIRSDRARIRRGYSSRLSLKGPPFEKGDGKQSGNVPRPARDLKVTSIIAAARSSLRKVIKKLTRTLERLMRTVTRSQRDPVDYQSLMSLSNKSRSDAIRTMTDLSSRVGSVRSSRSNKRRGRKSASTSASASTSSRAPRTHGDGRPRSRNKGKGSPRSTREDGLPTNSADSPPPKDKRVSTLTMSSGSTKLGEVRRRMVPERDDGAVYHGRVTYPLHPHSSPEAQKPRRRWGLFGR